ncbi:ornithine cyclodeaminase family protein [Alicyclobacillus fastidiosus]|uniref:Ornithine cyclodeaminase family protein n=1 Tax=Alicyclobacillus fastidiosus TaxID=392011 RepID=A0ABY6ZHK0_9BACL|nr:ornithine cyclodeaminase family protein [Alicyclobacillus fastidiosus]WAH42364.1 ornithine cyclodeaminase family protein [Alicyclobacillus fastidiosus]GMA64173.1 ornithine cyclodeaminase [Alicyclobacillus fastidiosus]
MYHVLTDQDIEKLVSMKSIVGAIERTFEEQANGTLVSPPRFRLETEQGDLVFTAGAATAIEKVIGFRVYDTYTNDLDGHEQLVCVFDSDTGVFKGIVIGNLLGAVRTGAIGGVAIKSMARTDAERLAVIGTGVQARTQLEAAVAVRDIKHVRVFSRNQENREAFAAQMMNQLEVEVVAVDSPKNCIRGADIVICATNSGTPVFDAEWLQPGVHINTVGPKSIKRHEVPIELGVRSSVIATDSIEQLKAYPTPHFLVGTPDEDRIIQLSEVVAGKTLGRKGQDDITLFCSVGLAGTEVVVANEIMKEAVDKE